MSLGEDAGLAIMGGRSNTENHHLIIIIIYKIPSFLSLLLHSDELTFYAQFGFECWLRLLQLVLH